MEGERVGSIERTKTGQRIGCIKTRAWNITQFPNFCYEIPCQEHARWHNAEGEGVGSSEKRRPMVCLQPYSYHNGSWYFNFFCWNISNTILLAYTISII